MPSADLLANLAFSAAMATSGRASAQRLRRAAEDPAAAQRRLLRAILGTAKDTQFGREHGYGRLHDPESFRAAVPIADYEAHRPWIDRQIAGEASITCETPVMYARTSGTTGEPKRIPVTPSVLAGLRVAQRAASFFQHRACPMFRGRILALGGAVREETLPDGTPSGSVTGLIYQTMPGVVRSKYVVPAEVFAIDDAELKYAVVTRLALQHGDLTAVATANPSTLLRLRDHARAHWSELLAELETGAFAAADALTDDQARAVRAALFPAPDRARALRAAAAHGEPTVAQLWPALAGVVTWTGGSCALAADVVRSALPSGARLIEAGYVASEFRGTVVVDVERSLGLPVLEDVFFEFVPVAAWDAGSRDTLLLHELEEGADYQVIATTRAGLARYWINDIVRSGPRIGATPTLTFVRKGRGITSITGEKLTEAQVNAALQATSARFALAVGFHLVLADEAGAVYRVFLEADGDFDARVAADAIDVELKVLNIEYASKRSSGRLRPLEARRLAPGAGAAYRRWCVARGQRDAQFKVLTLQYAQECAFDLTPWLQSDTLDAPRPTQLG
jgi:hypothetical protein